MIPSQAALMRGDIRDRRETAGGTRVTRPGSLGAVRNFRDVDCVKDCRKCASPNVALSNFDAVWISTVADSGDFRGYLTRTKLRPLRMHTLRSPRSYTCSKNLPASSEVELRSRPQMAHGLQSSFDARSEPPGAQGGACCPPLAKRRGWTAVQVDHLLSELVMLESSSSLQVGSMLASAIRTESFRSHMALQTTLYSWSLLFVVVAEKVHKSVCSPD